jgi:hypothetical protein
VARLGTVGGEPPKPAAGRVLFLNPIPPPPSRRRPGHRNLSATRRLPCRVASGDIHDGATWRGWLSKSKPMAARVLQRSGLRHLPHRFTPAGLFAFAETTPPRRLICWAAQPSSRCGLAWSATAPKLTPTMFSLGTTRHRLGYCLRIARPDPHLLGAIALTAVAVTDVPSAFSCEYRIARTTPVPGLGRIADHGGRLFVEPVDRPSVAHADRADPGKRCGPARAAPCTSEAAAVRVTIDRKHPRHRPVVLSGRARALHPYGADLARLSPNP